MSTKAKSSTNTGEDAVEILKRDHKEVKAMFAAFKKLKESEGANQDKAELVDRICTALAIHATIEEEIFYPAVRAGIHDQDLMDEADVEHAGAKDLIAQLRVASPEDDHYDAKVTVLSEMIDHHVKEEEGAMFPKAKKVIDTQQVGAEMASRKLELKDETNIRRAISVSDRKAHSRARPSTGG